ncbi:hypothetical protein B1H18_32835 [Streptomyces tsukubensis]|uniref:Polyketide synthase thioesterase domain-containing protein n=1 Tax=Streptomyces tsukubensis TaxID=83656 RepID=A0A1V3ZZ37_9ACTN|nr:hypothetical protein B1H18_32835 [Streptomyces tsukubensis]
MVLAVDFPITGRPESSFADLAPRLESDYAFWQTVPPSVSPGRMGGGDYVDEWASEVAESGLTVRAVLGFCVGSVYGAALADRLGSWQGKAPALILFDPEQATVSTLHWQFEKILRNMTEILRAEELAALRARAEELAQDRQRDVEQFTTELFNSFLPIGQEALSRSGLDAERTDEMLGIFGSLLSYLSSAARLDSASAWRRATGISSASPESGLNPHRSSRGAKSDAVSAEIRFELGHAELLGSAEVAEAIVKLLRN